MTWPWHLTRELEAAAVRERVLQLVIARLEVQLTAEQAAREAVERREAYWQARAERFLDQIALRQGNIGEPVMREVPPPPRSAAETAFGALAVTEIHRDRAGADRLAVNAVDTATAAQAVLEALS